MRAQNTLIVDTQKLLNVTQEYSIIRSIKLINSIQQVSIQIHVP